MVLISAKLNAVMLIVDCGWYGWLVVIRLYGSTLDMVWVIYDCEKEVYGPQQLYGMFATR